MSDFDEIIRKPEVECSQIELFIRAAWDRADRAEARRAAAELERLRADNENWYIYADKAYGQLLQAEDAQAKDHQHDLLRALQTAKAYLHPMIAKAIAGERKRPMNR